MEWGAQMGFLFGEIFMGWKRDKKVFFLLLGLSAAGIFSMGIAFYLFHDTEHQVREYKEVYEDVQFYSIADNFAGAGPEELEAEENTEKFRKFLELLTESPYFTYFMMYAQPVYMEDYKGKESNIYGYERSADLSGATKELTGRDGKVRKSTVLKAFWMGEGVLDYFGIQAKAGRGFQEGDFIFDPEGVFPVVLGADYAEDYKVGDKIYISFVFADGEAEVVSILEEGSNIYYRDRFWNLDHYIIMPVFENDTYEGKKIYNFGVNHFYTLRNSGVIATKLAVQDAQEIIQDYADQAGFGLKNVYYVTTYSTAAKESFGTGINMVQLLIDLIIIAAVIVICFFVCYCVADKIRRNRRYYAVLMLNGCEKQRIYLMVLADVLAVFVLAGVLACALYVIVVGDAGRAWEELPAALSLSGIFFAVLPGLAAAGIVFRSDLIAYLKEEVAVADDKRYNEDIQGRGKDDICIEGDRPDGK